MIFEKEEQGELVRLTCLVERLDAVCSDQAKLELRQFIGSETKKIEVDLSIVEFIDSSGISSMITAYRMLGDGCEIRVTGVSTEVGNVFRLLRLDKVFNLD